MERVEKLKRVEEQTQIRHQLLENGYVPLPNVDKRCMLKRWTEVQVDHDTINDWSDRASWMATGVRIEGDLLALDFDIDDAAMLDTIWDEIEDKRPDLLEKLDEMPLRGGKGEKICLFCRLDTGKIDKLWSKAFYNPAELEADPEGAGLHRLEVFSGQTRGRQVGVYGPHTFRDDEVLVSYRWADGRGLADVPRSELPALRRKDVFDIVDLVSSAMARSDWEYEASAQFGRIVEVRSYSLTPDMMFNTNRGELVSLADLQELARHDDGIRVSLSFKEGTAAQNVTRGLVAINPADEDIQIWDSATDTLYRPAQLDLRKMTVSVGEKLAARGLGGPTALPVDRRAPAAVSDSRDAVDPETSDKDKDPSECEVMASVHADGRRVVNVAEGNLSKATWEVAEWLAGSPDLYRKSSRVTFVTDDGSVVGMDDARLSVEIGGRVCCVREQKSGKTVQLVEVDPPAGLTRQVASVVGECGFNDLRGVVDVPVVRADGSLVTENGWDDESKLLVRVGRRFDGMIPDSPSREQAMAALDVLMHPFREYLLAGPESRGALLAALLTAVVRPSLPTAPAFVLDAPTAGSGKTRLGECLMALSGGGRTHAPLNVRVEEEIGKVLLSLLSQNLPAVMFDNQVGLLDSASLAAVLTMPTYSGRVLGKTETVHLETNLLMMFSGNNMTVVGDMTRRVLVIRIDPECEVPAARVFDFDPLQEVRTNRDSMVAAALTIIRWAVSQRRAGRVGSFEAWDVCVAQTVAALGLDEYMDPAEVLRATRDADPRLEETGALMHGLRGLFGNTWFTPREVCDAVRHRDAGTHVVADLLDDALKSVTALNVGRFLGFRKDTRVDGLRLVRRLPKSKKDSTMFRVASDADTQDVVDIGTWKEARQKAKERIEHLPRV